MSYTPELPVQNPGAFLWSFPYDLALKWCKFSLGDVEILGATPSRYEPQAVFIASLNSPQGVWEMLEAGGDLLRLFPVECFVFRTNHPNVKSWAKRFEAVEYRHEGHRSRYYMRSFEWNNLCLKVSNRNMIKRAEARLRAN